MTPYSLEANLTKTINIHEKPRVSSSQSRGPENNNDPAYFDLELLSRVSQLLEKDILGSDRYEDKNRWDDVLRLLCGKLEAVKGELINVNNCNKTLGQQKLVRVCIYISSVALNLI